MIYKPIFYRKPQRIYYTYESNVSHLEYWYEYVKNVYNPLTKPKNMWINQIQLCHGRRFKLETVNTYGKAVYGEGS